MNTNPNVNLTKVPNDFLERIKSRLNCLEPLIINSSKSIQVKNSIIVYQQKKIHGICQRTLQEYRDRRIIGFHQVGRKIMYRKSDFENSYEHYIMRSP